MSHDHAATKALPDDLLAYMRSHIKAKRDDLDGFLAIGNEVNRAAKYDRWLGALAAPAAPVAQPAVTPYNVGQWCMSEDECRSAGIDFGAYERGIADAAEAFARNAAHSPAPAPAAPVAQGEKEALREAQREAVMPLIGPLLDAWEGASQQCREELPELDKWLRRLNRAMEDAPASQPVSEPAEVSDADIRRVFLANGFTIKEGHDDLKPYVYAAARAVLALRPKVRPLKRYNVMSALALVPTDMSHQQKCEWIAQALNDIVQGKA